MYFHKFHQLFCCVLAVFIFISATGIRLHLHYCGDEVFDYALFGEASSCKKNKIADEGISIAHNSGCCSFKHFKIETSDNYKCSDIDKESNLNFDLTFTKIFTETLVEKSIFAVNNRIYPPPGKIKKNNIYLKIESLLI